MKSIKYGYRSINYNYQDRKPRQNIEPQFLENGSIYLTKTDLLKNKRNRLGGKISIFPMPRWKSYQIDNHEDIDVCKFYMTERIINKQKS